MNTTSLSEYQLTISHKELGNQVHIPVSTSSIFLWQISLDIEMSIQLQPQNTSQCNLQVKRCQPLKMWQSNI